MRRLGCVGPMHRAVVVVAQGEGVGQRVVEGEVLPAVVAHGEDAVLGPLVRGLHVRADEGAVGALVPARVLGRPAVVEIVGALADARRAVEVEGQQCLVAPAGPGLGEVPELALAGGRRSPGRRGTCRSSGRRSGSPASGTRRAQWRRGPSRPAWCAPRTAPWRRRRGRPGSPRPGSPRRRSPARRRAWCGGRSARGRGSWVSLLHVSFLTWAPRPPALTCTAPAPAPAPAPAERVGRPDPSPYASLTRTR